jgi:hypothetical protein
MITHELAWSWCSVNEANISFSAPGGFPKTKVSVLNGAIVVELEDFLSSVTACVQRQRELIRQGKISDRTQLMRNILAWHRQHGDCVEIVE